jgi:hypothetical protein
MIPNKGTKINNSFFIESSKDPVKKELFILSFLSKSSTIFVIILYPFSMYINSCNP